MDLDATETFAPVETFSGALQRFGVELPLKVSSDQVGDILDDAGEVVLQADPNGVRSDQDVDAIATLIVLAVNAAAGQLVKQVS